MHNIVRTALFVTVLPVLMPAQQTGTIEEPGTQQARRHSRPAGEAKPAPSTLSQDARRKFLKQHPKLQVVLRKKADTNGDGKLSAAEKKALHRLITARIAEIQAQRKKDGAGSDSRTGSRADKPRALRLDRNGDGTVDNAERKRGRHIKNRVDRNNDGKVGPAERKRAKKVKNRVDKNHDGRVGPVERKRAQRKKNRADRNNDLRVGPVERRTAKKVRARRNS